MNIKFQTRHWMCSLKPNPFVLFTVLCIFFFIEGCGYHVMGRGGRFPGGIASISVPFFINESGGGHDVSLLASELTSIVTPLFSKELANSGNVKVVSSGEAVLKGVIKGYTITPIAFTNKDVVKEYNLTLLVQLSIIKDNDSLWSGQLSDSEEFIASSNIDTFRSNERDALERSAVELAKIFKERVLEDF